MAGSTDRLAKRLVTWQRQYGRHHLPWQQTRDPYHVWLSEIMLQQTQVTTVRDYYQRFLEQFPSVRDLALADIDTVLSRWAGLGYYARARNLHACAQAVVRDWGGEFPRCAQDLQTLPGIGPSTAAAIAAFCYGEQAAILDGNVKRVLARHFGIDDDVSQTRTINKLWAIARQELPDARQITQAPDTMARYTQGLMDLGATVCVRRKPLCKKCPLQATCIAYRDNLTDVLPFKAVKTRARRIEELQFFLIRHDDHILLQKRPPKGIWGGLWCLPMDLSVIPDLSQASPLPMASFDHELTHFRMIITPSQVDLPVHEERPAPEDINCRWVHDDALDQYGLPKPIRDLVRPNS